MDRKLLLIFLNDTLKRFMVNTHFLFIREVMIQ